MVGLRCETYDSVAVGQPQRASVRAVAHFLGAWHRTRREMAKQSLVGKWRPHRQPQRQRTCGGDVAAPESCTSTLAQGRRREIAHRPDCVVKLADAREACGECDVAAWQLGGFDQRPGGLPSLLPRN